MNAELAACAASDPRVIAVTTAQLERGSAVDAIVSGLFAAAAYEPSVLLGPVQILVGGTGVGLRAVDGRVHQPGRGVPRPRGFLSPSAVPATAKVAVPAFPAALAAALATLGSIQISTAVGPAIEIARSLSPERARVLKLISRRGAIAFTEAPIASELVAVAGRAEGGLLTQEDLDELRPAVKVATSKQVGRFDVARVPWKDDQPNDSSESSVVDASASRILAVSDGHGCVAIACYEVHSDGLTIPDLGLVAPAIASPVMRGHTRTRPGSVRPAAAPIALFGHSKASEIAIGLGAMGRAETILEQALNEESSTMPPFVGVMRLDGASRIVSAETLRTYLA